MEDNQEIEPAVPVTEKKLTPIEKSIIAFRNQRALYNAEIKNKVPLLKDVKTLIEANVHFLSLRQRILEDNHVIIETFDRLIGGFFCGGSQRIVHPP